MSIAPFSSDVELLNYASWFWKDRVRALKKDLAICMTANEKQEHAYFPALMTCIAFADLLSGFHAGKLEGHGLSDLKKYISDFFKKPANYNHVDILYMMFRHKIAHLACTRFG